MNTKNTVYQPGSIDELGSEAKSINVQNDTLKKVRVSGRERVNLRALSKQVSRQKILNSARTLFRERGFEDATLRDIAKHAGLSTGAVFASFVDKLEIFVQIVEEENAHLVKVMLDAHDPNLELSARLHHQMISGYRAAQIDTRLILSAFVMNWMPNAAHFNAVGKLNEIVRQTLFETLIYARSQKEIPEHAPIKTASEILEDMAFANIRRNFRDKIPLNELAQRLKIQVDLIVAGLKVS